MLKLKRVAITGTISSGKSTVLSILRSLGAYTVDADQLLHTAFSKDILLRKQIIELFGSKVLLPNGDINRAYISEQVALRDDLALHLELLCHPYLLNSLDKLYTELLLSPESKSMFVAEIPLLFESQTKFADWFDLICVVEAPVSLCKERYCKKLEKVYPNKVKNWNVPKPTLDIQDHRNSPGCTRGDGDDLVDRDVAEGKTNSSPCLGINTTIQQFSWRLSRQLPGDEKRKQADYVIENTGSLDELQNKTQKFFDWSISTT